ncbi:ATP-binding protein [Balneola sp. MJW-20]|uniref:ATP-binding protein n=1 Tax=Gracilimonas aurantiaca TaxID=3234185 RepID=UPI003465885B
MNNTYFSFNALISLRSSGYKNTSYAIAELIDNSFDAEADTVKVIFIDSYGSNNRKYIKEIIVADDGTGMSRDVLQLCLQFGNTQNTDMDEILSKKIVGKFGFGLPNASLSQCKRVKVYSKQKGKSLFSSYLDLNELGEKESVEIPPAKEDSLPDYYKELSIDVEDNSGTVVSWSDLDRTSKARVRSLFREGKPIYGRIYKYLLSQGKKVQLEHWHYDKSNNKYQKKKIELIEPNDPLFLMEDTYIKNALKKDVEKNADYSPYFQKFLKNGKSLPTNTKLEDYSYTYPFEWKGKRYEFEIITSIAKGDIQKPGIRNPGNQTDTGKEYGKKMDDGNISFVRSDREIAAGHFGFYKPTEPNLRWISIEIKFNPDADDLMGVHNNKQSLEFTKQTVNKKGGDSPDVWDPFTATFSQAKEKLWLDLSTKIAACWKNAKNQTKKYASEWDAKHIADDDEDNKGLPGGSSQTDIVIKDVDGERSSSFSEEEKIALFDRLKERYKEVPNDHIVNAIRKYDKAKVRGCVLYSHSEGQHLWSYTHVANFLIVVINTNHAFYQNIIAPLRSGKAESALAGIELFLTSLAWEEHEQFSSNEDESYVLETYRNYVGIHLHRYIKKHDISIDAESLISEGND